VIDPDEDEETAMKRLMGFVGFKSTKNTKVPGNDKLYGVRKDKKTEYRQYMNRVGGFNRPLSPTRLWVVVKTRTERISAISAMAFVFLGKAHFRICTKEETQKQIRSQAYVFWLVWRMFNEEAKISILASHWRTSGLSN
jgi:hypothetical protein